MSRKIERIVFHLTVNKKNVEMELTASGSGKMPSMICPDYSYVTRMDYYYDDEQCGSISNADEIRDQIADWYNSSILVKGKEGFIPPEVTYADVTEKILLGSSEISEENLSSKEHGIWAYTGLRKIKIENLPSGVGGKQYVSINFKRINEVLCNDDNLVMDTIEINDNTAIASIDTDYLGRKFDTEEYSDREYLQFIGCIEHVCEDKKHATITFKYPISVTVRNTNKNMKIVSRNFASIDFGTSSTCVAIKSGTTPELLTLSASEDTDDGNRFENPTNLMLFDWDSLYEEWRDGNDRLPILFKGDEQDHISGQKVDFNYGYEVKDLMEYAKKEELHSIMTLLKMIPYELSNGSQLDVNPMFQSDEFVYIVSAPEEQDATHFDPVAFYGYLVGKAINDPSKRECIYNKFKITCPVKFNDEVKEKLRHSLEYGLMRSLPKNLRSTCKVTMEIEEPVAYIGALCGTEYFKVEDGEKKRFAVFDFGGGTLDFSYGIASSDPDNDFMIRLLGIGGHDGVGGERLIERITFWIYKNNLNSLVDERIPIILPENEQHPDGLPENLIAHTSLAYANTHRINELISRRIFENRDLNENPLTMDLFDEDGDEQQVTLAYDVDDIKYDLEGIISNMVQSFAQEMDAAFENDEDYDRNDVWIFKAGNSSKNEFIDPHMDIEFPNHEHIQMVDQLEDGSEEYQRYAITPKTAIAFGQFNLANIELIRSSLLFKYYVGYIKSGTGTFKTCIKKNSSDTTSWEKFRKVKGDEVEIFYAESEAEVNPHSKILEVSDYKGETLYLRIVDEKTIQCGIESEDNDDFIVIDTIVLDGKE